jgi:16S rRNA (cytosine1402-N4)-methyltransferase
MTPPVSTTWLTWVYCSMRFHKSVLLNEAVDSLCCRRGGVYVDGTLGGGGHAYEILSRIVPEGLLVGIDIDEEAIGESEIRLSSFGDRKILVRGNFSDIDSILSNLGIDKVDGILLDLGVSSHQLDTAERGFSFSLDGPLDMRMDTRAVKKAFDIVNSYSGEALKKIVRNYGEEKMAGRIARAITAAREEAPIKTTDELAAVVKSSLPAAVVAKSKIHPATKTFQALRIAVNDELASLQAFIGKSLDRLRSDGRLSIISFHSLEDRIVKDAFRSAAKGCTCPPDLPVCACGKKPLLRLVTKKSIKPGDKEVEDNNRARSARLRTAERI